MVHGQGAARRMLIQEFCRATGLGRDTVRYYVKRGLLTPTRGSARVAGVASNRYQVFDARQVERARLIRAAQGLGFTLADIAALAKAYESGTLTDVRRTQMLRDQIAELDRQARRLATIRAYMQAKLEWLDSGRRGTPPAFAPVAEASASAPPGSDTPLPARRHQQATRTVRVTSRRPQRPSAR